MFAFVVTIFVYAILAPIINDAITPVVTYFESNPNDVTPAIVMLLQLTPFALLLGIVLSILNQAVPQREGYA
jgi:hypothetical protein